MTSKYEFIDGEKANYPIVLMCVWSHVSRSGYCEWLNRPTSATASRRLSLAVEVANAFKQSRGTYGYQRVHAELVRHGVEIGPELARALVRDTRPWPRLRPDSGDRQPVALHCTMAERPT